MLRALLSDDLPRSRWLSLALLAILVGLALAPFLFPGAKSLNVAAKVCVFIVLAASFDLLLGYTGIVSFAHTMFFGIGAYGVAIALTRLGPGWDAVAVGVLAGLAMALVLAVLIGLFSLRVRTIFFASQAGCSERMASRATPRAKSSRSTSPGIDSATGQCGVVSVIVTAAWPSSVTSTP